MATSKEKTYKKIKLDNNEGNEIEIEKKYILCIKKIRKMRHILQLERLILENRLKELKSGDGKMDTKENKVNTEESPSALALRIMQSSMDSKKVLNEDEFDIDAFCNDQKLNLNVGGSNQSRPVKQNDEEDEEEEEVEEEEDEQEEDPDDFIIDMNMFMNGA